MKNLSLLFIGILFLQVNSYTKTNYMRAGDNSLSYIYEDFEGENFPPPGWILEYTGYLYWKHTNLAGGYGTSTASALFENFMASAGISQSLVLTSLGPTIPGDSLCFDHAYATYSGEVDKLVIETSDDGGATYSTLITLNGGVSGPLVTAPPSLSYFIPSPSQWASKQYALPAGTNRIRFRAISGNGNNLYLDNISIGFQYSIDVGVQSINIANPTLTVPQFPKAVVKNHGYAAQSFDVTMIISPGQYSSVKTVTQLNSNHTAEVMFDEWLPDTGSCDITVYTSLGGDLDNSNDTAEITIEIIQPQQVQNINALYKEGQVFVTWDNISLTGIKYTLYKSSVPIHYGNQLASAQNLGSVRDNSAKNIRLSNILGGDRYLKIDSSGTQLSSSQGLFVATSTEDGSFYYAITTKFNGIEDTTIQFGINSLQTAVTEVVSMPRPVWQETQTIQGRVLQIYAQFVSKVTSPIYPQMTNEGSFVFHFAVRKKGSLPDSHPITFHFRPSEVSFLHYITEIGDPDEWIVSIDDWLPNGQTIASLYYGYHEDYDIFANSGLSPTGGTIYNYTAARIAHTVNWCLKNLPVDTTRVYMRGLSLGAIGVCLNALMIPEKIAAAIIIAPIFDPSSSAVNWYSNQLWGTYETNLVTNEGYTRNQRLNSGYLLTERYNASLPIMFTFCGKNDINTGWSEKIAFYDTINVTNHGGYHFWSLTDHSNTMTQWVPNFPNFSFVTRYRTDLSYPAFSNCSLNNDPGNGTPANGDPIGSINGYLNWEDSIVDSVEYYEITLYVKDLITTQGTLTASDSGTTDITLRRLQNFSVPPGETVVWENWKNGLKVQQGSFSYEGGPITIPGVKVYKDSNRLGVFYNPLKTAEQRLVPKQFELGQNYPNPFNPSTKIRYSIPQRSKVIIRVYDVLGNEIETLLNKEEQAGTYELTWDAVGLPSGVYFYQLRALDFVQTKKLILLR